MITAQKPALQANVLLWQSPYPPTPSSAALRCPPSQELPSRHAAGGGLCVGEPPLRLPPALLLQDRPSTPYRSQPLGGTRACT